jgi:NADH:ubiquinone oxidoreductase subunit K
MVSLTSYVAISVILFVLGIFTVFVRKNIIGMLMGVKLVLGAVGLNFVAFNYFKKGNVVLDGQIFTLFIMIIGAAETVVILALMLALYKQRKQINVDNFSDMKG